MIQDCSLSKATDLPSLQLAAFNGIFLKNFYTSEALIVTDGKSYGPIAILGDMYAPNYHFAEQRPLSQCSAMPVGFEDYGLVLQGNSLSTVKPFIRGNAYLSGSGSVIIVGRACAVKPGSQSIFDDNAVDAYKSGSYYLATLRPDLKLENLNVLKSVGPQANLSYHVITLNSCGGVAVGCVDVPFDVNAGINAGINVGIHLPNLAANISLLSDARGLLSLDFPYVGLSDSGIQWPKDATLVINVSIFLQ